MKGAVPVFRDGDDLRVGEILTEAKTVKGALFYALPSEGKDPPATTVPLYANTEGGYGLKGADTQRPICRVWRSPWAP